MIVLALDLSTTVIGYSVFKVDTEELLKCHYYVYEEDDLLEKGFEVQRLLTSLHQKYEFDTVVIEERLKKFTQGKTNADAMFKTAQLNYITQFICRQHGYPVAELNVNVARGFCFPGFHKIARAIKDQKQKEVAFDMACKILGEDFFPKKILKSGPRKGLEVYVDEAKDMADSWVLGRAFMEQKKAPPKLVKVTKKASKKKKA